MDVSNNLSGTNSLFNRFEQCKTQFSQRFHGHFGRNAQVLCDNMRSNTRGEKLDDLGWNGYGSIPINTIFRGMNIHLPAILMFTKGTRFWHCQMTLCFWVDMTTWRFPKMLRTDPDVCPEPVFPRTKRLFFSTDPHGVRDRLLPQITLW